MRQNYCNCEYPRCVLVFPIQCVGMLLPRVGANGNWYVDNRDTGVKASGTNGKDGKDGLTPFIGLNYNWWIGTTDTGINAQGIKGDQGFPGVNGQDGSDGADGADGVDGVNGSDGKDGTDGIDGKDGVDGIDGEDGVDGITPNIQIGTTTTLAANLPATATITGSVTNPLLNLGIPLGIPGTGGDVKLRFASINGVLLNDTNQPSVVLAGGRIPWKSINNNQQGILKPSAIRDYFLFTELGRYLCIFNLRCNVKTGDDAVINFGLYAQNIAKAMVTTTSLFVTSKLTDISGSGIFDVVDLTEQYNLINNGMVSINAQGATSAQTFYDAFVGLNGVNQVDGLSCQFIKLGDI